MSSLEPTMLDFRLRWTGIPVKKRLADALPLVPEPRYAQGMKTAVSIPDEIFEKVERLAEREQRSRSEVYSAALREYVARHAPDETTEAMNQAYDRVGTGPDGFLTVAAQRVMERVEW